MTSTPPRHPTLWTLATVLLALPALLPLLVIASSWLAPQSETWAHLARTTLPELLLHTVILMLGVGVGTLGMGASLAWLTATCDFPGRKLLDWALILPLSVPAYVLAFCFLGFFDFGGPLQQWLADRYGFNHFYFPNVRHPVAVVLTLTLVFYPYVYMLARNSFLAQGRRLLEASRVLGRSPWGAFFHAALPMARPALAAGVSLAIMETLADFGAVSVFNYDTFTTAIYKAWFGLHNLPAAAQLASLLLLFIALAMSGEKSLRGRRRYHGTDLGGKGERLRLRGWRAGLATLYGGGVVTLAFLLPVGQLAVWVWQDGVSPLESRFLQLMGNTLMLGLSAALVTTAGGLLLALARKRHPTPLSALTSRLATLGYALPGSVLAVGIMLVLVGFDRHFTALLTGLGFQVRGPWLSIGLTALLLAYFIRFLAVSHGPIDSGLERIRPSLPEAAQLLGVSGWPLLWRVHLPILRPSLLTAMLLVLVEVMKEMPATLLLRPFGWNTLSVRVFEMTSEGQWQQAALPALALVLAGLLPVILLVRRSAHG